MAARTRRAAAAPAADTSTAMHPAVDAVLETIHDQLGTYEIPEEGGVLDVDALFGSLNPLMEGFGDTLKVLADKFGDSPVHGEVVEMLAAFASSLASMADDAAEVHQQWQTNPDNEHDLRRARGEITNASLFNV